MLGTRNTATPKPLNRPMSAPTINPAGSDRTAAPGSLSSNAATVVAAMADAVIVHGTERSMCPIMITARAPIATTPRNEAICICCSR